MKNKTLTPAIISADEVLSLFSNDTNELLIFNSTANADIFISQQIFDNKLNFSIDDILIYIPINFYSSNRVLFNKFLNGKKSVFFKVSISVSTIGSSKWLSAIALPWPGICFITGKILLSRSALHVCIAKSTICSQLSPSALSPIIAWVFGVEISSKGTQSTLIPTSFKSKAIFLKFS